MRGRGFRRAWWLGALLVAATIPSASAVPAADRRVQVSRPIRKAVRAVPASTVAVTVSVIPASEIPKSFVLQQSSPNPFNRSTAIRFACPKPEHITVRIYDVSGREVATLVDEIMNAGVHSVVWDGKDATGRGASSGIYLCRLTGGRYTATRKLTLLR
jgi:hypothetical protein